MIDWFHTGLANPQIQTQRFADAYFNYDETFSFVSSKYKVQILPNNNPKTSQIGKSAYVM